MKKSKQELIEYFLKEDLKPGDWVVVKGVSYDKHKTERCDVISVDGDNIIVKSHSGGTKYTIKKDQIVEKDPYKVGYNPFKQEHSRLRFIAFTLHSILHQIGFEKQSRSTRFETVDGSEIPELNWNPTMVGSDGKRIPYQRGFVWSLNDKQLLIESIYQNLDIGKIVIKKNSYEYVREQAKLGNKVAFKDVVDGKQRLNALLGFVQDEFEDLHGNIFSNLSQQAQNKFFDFMGVAYGEMDENTTDEEIQQTFLKINFTGVQMSQEHIDYVKSIELKKVS